MIKWNKVTWYPQIVAIISGVVIFTAGFILGIYNAESNEVHDSVKENVYTDKANDNSNFRTIPNIQYSDYRNSDRYLANPRTLSEVRENGNKFYEENYEKYPEWAGYYAPINSRINEVQDLDIDQDSKNEKIIYYSCYGCNAPSRNIDIVKNNRIIFTAEGGNLRVEPIEKEKGFYVYTTHVPRRRGETKVEFRLNSDNEYRAISETDIYYD